MVFVVTGATGFLGFDFILTALKENNTVYAVARNEEKMQALFPNTPFLKFIKSELSNLKDLPKLIKNADVFVNFAWEGISATKRDNTNIQSKNIQYSKDAIIAAKQLGCKLFVSSGSQAEYGIVSTEIYENTPCKPYSEYGKAKLELCKECDRLRNELNIKYLHLRIFSVFGKRDHEHTLLKSSIKKLQDNISIELTQCTQKWNFLYVKDAVMQIYLLCNYAVNKKDYKSEIYNLASEDTRELKSYIYELKDIIKSDSELKFGAIKSPQIVSLNPNIEKLKKTINFTTRYSFKMAIEDMIK